MAGEDVEFLLKVALEESENEQVNYHIRTAIQRIQIQTDLEKLDE